LRRLARFTTVLHGTGTDNRQRGGLAIIMLGRQRLEGGLVIIALAGRSKKEPQGVSPGAER